MALQILSKISKGTKMDQVYISKNRNPGFEVGSYVVISPALEKQEIKPYYYQIKQLEPVKIQIINKIFEFLSDADNVIIAGSFLEKGFTFNDMDVMIINGTKNPIEKFIKEQFGMESHIINITYEALRKGLNTDPLFQMLLSKFVSKKRILIKIEPEINYKLLDIHLLRSKLLIDNFDYLNGKEKYKMTRNMFAIKRFLKKELLTKENIDKDINIYFGKNSVNEILDNTIPKIEFVRKYRKLYNDLFNEIMKGARNAE